MTREEYRLYQERIAARLRSLIATATTPAMRARLSAKAEEHEHLAETADERELELAKTEY